MNQLRKRALWSLAIFSPVMLLLLILFFAGGGPDAFTKEESRRIAIAGLFFLGYGAFLLMLYRTRVRPGPGPAVTDERDVIIARRANSVAFIAVMVFVFALSITLWTVYERRDVLPAGWMYFLAYATVFFGILSHATATLVLDSRMVVHGEG